MDNSEEGQFIEQLIAPLLSKYLIHLICIGFASAISCRATSASPFQAGTASHVSSTTFTPKIIPGLSRRAISTPFSRTTLSQGSWYRALVPALLRLHLRRQRDWGTTGGRASDCGRSPNSLQGGHDGQHCRDAGLIRQRDQGTRYSPPAHACDEPDHSHPAALDTGPYCCRRS